MKSQMGNGREWSICVVVWVCFDLAAGICLRVWILDIRLGCEELAWSRSQVSKVVGPIDGHFRLLESISEEAVGLGSCI